MKRNGFTLVEILVIVGAMLLIITSISGIMFGVFSSKSKNQAISKITQNGNWILDELTKNVLNASSETENGVRFTCPLDEGGGDSITITNIKDGEKTTISCLNTSEGFKIASISAKAVGTTVYLFQNNNNLVLSSCDNFVVCSTLPSLQLSKVKFNFNLESPVFGLTTKITKPFSLDISLRN